MTSSSAIWRGPRPLREGDDLIGRDRALATALTVLGSHSILEITAPSGVGKSSFVNAGLLRALRERGSAQPLYAPVASWADIMRDPELAAVPERQRGRKLYELALATCPVHGDAQATVTSYTDVSGEGSAYPPIVFFDQFEECIRYSPRIADQLMAFVTTWSAESGVRHIVAARSEYKEQLRVLESNVEAQTFHLSLPPLRREADIRAVITAPAHGRITVTGDVVDALVQWWQDAVSGGGNQPGVAERDPGAMVGLLHLQAVLWLLGDRLDPDRGELDASYLNEFASLAERHGVAAMFAWAMTEYVRASLAEHLDPSTWWAPDDHTAAGRRTPDSVTRDLIRQWSSGPQQVVAQVARFLSTSGYKVPQSYRTLLSLIATGGSADESSRRLMSSLTADPDSVVGKWEPDGAGIAAEWSKSDVARTVAWTLREALERMTQPEINILRPYLGQEDAIFELVHDGLGLALRQWAEGSVYDGERAEPGLLDRPAVIYNSIAERSGQSIPVGLSKHDIRADDGWGWDDNVSVNADGATVARLRWVGCNIWGKSFEDVAFIGSVFTGSVFGEVTLRNVTLAACDLKGVVVIESTLQGVEIVGGAAKADHIDTLTFTGARDADVSFRGLENTTGLFLNGLSGGSWTFEKCRISHLHLAGAKEAAPVTLRFVDCTIDLISVDETLKASAADGWVTVDEKSTFAHVVNAARLQLPS